MQQGKEQNFFHHPWYVILNHEKKKKHPVFYNRSLGGNTTIFLHLGMNRFTLYFSNYA